MEFLDQHDLLAVSITALPWILLNVEITGHIHWLTIRYAFWWKERVFSPFGELHKLSLAFIPKLRPWSIQSHSYKRIDTAIVCQMGIPRLLVSCVTSSSCHAQEVFSWGSHGLWFYWLLQIRGSSLRYYQDRFICQVLEATDSLTPARILAWFILQRYSLSWSLLVDIGNDVTVSLNAITYEKRLSTELRILGLSNVSFVLSLCFSETARHYSG